MHVEYSIILHCAGNNVLFHSDIKYDERSIGGVYRQLFAFIKSNRESTKNQVETWIIQDLMT